jgi:hypothetical protein
MTIVSGIQPAGSRRLAPAEPLREVRYEIGAPVTCQDGPCGELSRLVVDPLRGVVTHLVVEPRHHHALARLVPVAIVEIDDGTLRLRCSRAIFCALQYAEEMEFLTPLDPTDAMTYTGGAMSPLDMLVWPYWAPARTPIRHERVPLGEVEIRRGEHVRALDGPIGKIQGLVVDPADYGVTHVLLHAGHLWGARDVAIPIGAVGGIDAEGVHVSLSKHAVGELPELELTRPGGQGS